MTREEFRTVMTAEFPQLPEAALERFDAAEELYREWNARINVVSRKDIDGLYDHHFLHSVCIAAYVRRFRPELFSEGTRVLDIGTGGGFPGIPLAIMFPEVSFTLCDSIGKKIKVAAAVAESLELQNVTAVNARAEALQGPFDTVVSRAVTSLDNFMPWLKGKKVGNVLYLKGGDIEEELYNAAVHCGLHRDRVRIWKIEDWLADGWFKGKYVVDIKTGR